MTSVASPAHILATVRAMPEGGDRAAIAQALGGAPRATDNDWLTATLRRLANAGQLRRQIVHRAGLTRPTHVWVAVAQLDDRAIAPAEKTPPELLRAARDLRERGFVGVAPIDKRASRWIVGEMKLSAGEVISLARREVSVAGLMGLA